MLAHTQPYSNTMCTNLSRKKLSLLIIHYGSISRIDGTSERIFQIAKGLGNLGVNVTIANTVQYSFKIKNSINNIHNIKAPKKSNILSIINWMIEIFTISIRFRRYDVIQIEGFSVLWSLFLYFFLWPFGKKFIIVFHDKYWEHHPKKGIYSRFELVIQRIILHIFDVLITPGLSIKNWFVSLHGEQFHKKIIVIPNGVPILNINDNFFSRSLYLRKKLGIDPDSYIACFFGSMTFKPNYDTAIYLYKISNNISNLFKEITGKRLIFIIAGIGSKDLPTTDFFIPLGFIKNLEELFSLSDVIVLPHTPSYSGPHIKTIYSFLSCKPVIASKDAVKDMPGIIQGKHFLLFDINKPFTLVNALEKLYYNKKLRIRITNNAQLYCKKFSWKNIASLHFRLYAKLLNNEKD